MKRSNLQKSVSKFTPKKFYEISVCMLFLVPTVDLLRRVDHQHPDEAGHLLDDQCRLKIGSKSG
jgi:hypothetical protein